MLFESILAVLAVFIVFLLMAERFINIGIKMADKGVTSPVKLIPSKKKKLTKEEQREADVRANWENYHGHGSPEREIK